MNYSIEYYDQNAHAFRERTIHCEMEHLYQKFLQLLNANGKILDAGCGPGRDARYFKQLGFDVTAFDASKEMVRLASDFLKKEVIHCRFQDLSFDDAFDGVWASASLLHVPYDELRSVFEILHKSLKDDGVFFGSFKYGNEKRNDGQRIFYDMNEEKIVPYFENLFEKIQIWSEADNRSQVSPSPAQKWLYFLCRKKLESNA